jgi:predicted AAA+ superfamily ATPase
MITRKSASALLDMAKGFYVLLVTGPRQSGKTTLVRQVFSDKPYVSLEDINQREFAKEDPQGFLARYRQGAILDEVQRCPDLLSYIQTVVDEDKMLAQFVLTGSQQFGLLNRVSQSLAGRVGILELLPFSAEELQTAKLLPLGLDELLFKGGYPPLYDRALSPSAWHKSYMQTYLERDVRQLINVVNLTTFQKFIRLCAARTGQLLNMNNLANECGISHTTVKSWLSVLEASYLIYILPPHHKNFNKRLVKTPKLYFYDTGLAAWLLGIRDTEHLSIHASRAALFENWVVIELVKHCFNRIEQANLYFWRDNTGNEVDIIIDRGECLQAIEIKSGQTLSAEAFNGLKRWLEYAQDEACPPCLCYGGNDSYRRSGIAVTAWQDINQWYERH